jgi:peptidoglycan/xylan/chitin deacetylase (PgdA/CDA1 family)
MINLTIAIDDVNPKKDWRIFGDKTEKYLFDLNKQFGAKFTLFIPSNHHGDAKLSENKNWVNELLDAGIFELAAHGHYHQTSDKARLGECEFYELNNPKSVDDRLTLLFEEWNSVGYYPSGWRNPGWLASPASVAALRDNFKYSAIHYEHNRGLDWGTCKTVYGADGIHQTDIKIHNNDAIMFQSHIFGDWNDNVWNEDNFDQFKASLDHLVNNNEISFKTIKEYIDGKNN